VLAQAVVVARLVLAAAVACASGAAAASTGLAVPLVLEEPAGVARHAFPATASVPLPRGRLARLGAVWLAGPAGEPEVVQADALERWPDGSVRWLFLDFLADVPAGGHVTYTLHGGPPPRPPRGPRVRLTSERGGRTLDTGPLRARIDDAGSTLLAELAAGRTSLVGPIPLPALAAGGRGEEPVPGRVTVETAGPVRTELLLAGHYADGLAYEIRLAAFAGQPFLRIQHTLTNLADAHYTAVRGLTFALPGRFTAAALGIDGATRALDDLARAHALRQSDATPALLDGDPVGRHGDGWARATGGGAAVTVVSRYFWEEYPQALTVARDALRLELLAGDDRPVELGSGAAKTHELWIALEPAEHAVPAADLAAALRAPLVALPAADWIVASRALPQALAPGDPGASDFLARLTAATRRYLATARTERWDDGPPVPCDQRPSAHPRVGFYGALNWGDWNFPGYRSTAEGCDAWGNLEYDLPQVLGLGWAATGSRLFYDAFIPAARHYRDVDVIHHWAEHPEWVGMNHPHKALHFAFESPNTIDLGHTWVEGLLTHWRLTGEVRSLEAARAIADALARLEDKAGNPRQYGWPLIALGAVYDATGERRYVDAAMRYADGALAAMQPTPAAGDWKMGILADGLAYAWQASGDDRLRRWLVRYADALLAAPERARDPRYALPLGYLAARTGDARYERAARQVARDLVVGTWGKPLAIDGRTGFRLLAPLALIPAPAAPRPASPPAPRRR